MTARSQYGINVDTLHEWITQPISNKQEWGEHMIIVSDSAFRLERVIVLPGMQASIQNKIDDFETTLWVEEGHVVVEGVSLDVHELVALPPRHKYRVSAEDGAVIYLFLGPTEDGSIYLKKEKPFDYRDKYWGNIQSIVSKAYAGKRMFVQKGKHASLEYHCRKTEGYYIHSGTLLLRLRAGRAEDRLFTLGQGNVSFTPPGLMHQRGGLEDTIIIEISTRDEDSDSFLVEDGQRTAMPQLPMA